MALWGKRFNTAGTGTLDLVAGDTTVEGNSTAFTTQLENGDSITSDAQIFKVNRIVDNDTIIVSAEPEADASTEAFTYSETPKWLSDSELAVVSKKTTAQAKDGDNRADGIRTPGWVKVVEYTDQNSNTRRRVEVLATFKSS